MGVFGQLMVTKPLPEGEGSLLLPAAAVRFDRGARLHFEALYREHFQVVERAVGRVLHGADKETVIHEVFLRLMNAGTESLTAHESALPAWLAAVARNHAIDYQRRRRFECPTATDPEPPDTRFDGERFERQAEARLLIARFRSEQLPAKWAPVFELRFIQQLGQADAARELGITRTTLAYQEYRVRNLLRRFLRKLEP